MLACLAQLNPTVGCIKGNVEQLAQVLKGTTADLLIFPELFLTGYPPKDLLFKKDFLQQVKEGFEQILDLSHTYPQVAVVLGMPWQDGGGLHNSAVVLQNGTILGVQHKRNLTRFRLFNEWDYFTPGRASQIIVVHGKKVGLALGLELDEALATELKAAGAEVIVNPAAIPFQTSRKQSIASFEKLAGRIELPILHCAQVGANDELIFAGGSCAFHARGKLMAVGTEFESAQIMVDLESDVQDLPVVEEDETARVYQALVLGLRDYVLKSGMKQVILGLSGGLDSAVAATLACDAVGAENVWAICQPGPYSPPSSVEDARGLAENLGVRFDVLPINELYESTLTCLDKLFNDSNMGVAEENIQARLRGLLWMALSNKFGGLVLTNSNKSELAVGYCTLYGDMNGGLAVLGDVYKTMVYQLAYYINRDREIIPWNTIEKPPSAELRPNQRDDETLPPYDILDGIIHAYLDQGQSISEIIASGYDPETVHWVIKTINSSDYKRRQAALILRITTPVLGQERNVPLAAQKNY